MRRRWERQDLCLPEPRHCLPLLALPEGTHRRQETLKGVVLEHGCVRDAQRWQHDRIHREAVTVAAAEATQLVHQSPQGQAVAHNLHLAEVVDSHNQHHHNSARSLVGSNLLPQPRQPLLPEPLHVGTRDAHGGPLHVPPQAVSQACGHVLGQRSRARRTLGLGTHAADKGVAQKEQQYRRVIAAPALQAFRGALAGRGAAPQLGLPLPAQVHGLPQRQRRTRARQQTAGHSRRAPPRRGGAECERTAAEGHGGSPQLALLRHKGP
mmetsp:Transcript_120729/g.336889  ORF Transcript_120729/g.336889 Transcript_120729/m.336889 type:complete len:266 (-) Transcript_120729:78-875(-)